MKNGGEAIAHGIQKSSNQTYIVVLKSLDWANFTATVEFKDSPGLEARGRLATVSGGGGTLYPPYMVGDLIEARVTGHDLNQLLASRIAERITNPYFYDKSDVLLCLSPYAKSGEPSGRKASSPPAEGQWLLVHDSGVEISIAPDGEVVIKAKSGGKIYLGGKTGAKKALVDGDSNVAGAVSATQSTVWIGTP